METIVITSTVMAISTSVEIATTTKIETVIEFTKTIAITLLIIGHSNRIVYKKEIKQITIFIFN